MKRYGTEEQCHAAVVGRRTRKAESVRACGLARVVFPALRCAFAGYVSVDLRINLVEALHPARIKAWVTAVANADQVHQGLRERLEAAGQNLSGE